MKIEWHDKSSYSRNDKNRIPSIWRTNLYGIDVTVHRHIYHDGWLLSSTFLNIDKKQLQSDEIEEAKSEALSLVKKAIVEFKKKIEEALSVLE